MPPNPNFIGWTESNCSSQSWNVQSIIEMRIMRILLDTSLWLGALISVIKC
jgi:hypothetical protein